MSQCERSGIRMATLSSLLDDFADFCSIRPTREIGGQKIVAIQVAGAGQHRLCQPRRHFVKGAAGGLVEAVGDLGVRASMGSLCDFPFHSGNADGRPAPAKGGREIEI